MAPDNSDRKGGTTLVTTNTSGAAGQLKAPTLAEDLLLLLFQPDSGVIAGETTLFYVLGGAMLADLALHERVTTPPTRSGGVTVEAVEGGPPSDEIFGSMWDYITARPRDVQTILAAIGPNLRRPVLSRLITRGDIREEKRKALGLFPRTILTDGGTGRRQVLLENVRDVLADDLEPTPRIAALAALIWGSGTLPQFDPVIPWNSVTITRAQELARGNWGATAVGAAVTRTMNAIVVNSIIVATTSLPH